MIRNIFYFRSFMVHAVVEFVLESVAFLLLTLL